MQPRGIGYRRRVGLKWLFSRSLHEKYIRAGLLTYSHPERLPTLKGSGLKLLIFSCKKHGEHTAAGTVPDSHRIPFSSQFALGTWNGAKI